MCIKFSSDYLLFSQSEKFHELCKPLIAATEIETVSYYKMYKNGDFLHFNTNPEMNHFMFVETNGEHLFDYTIFDALFQKEQSDKNKICLFSEDIYNYSNYWDDMSKSVDAKDIPILTDKFNINASFEIVERYDDCYEGFWFMVNSKKTGYNFFANHLSVLEEFILYIKEHARELIKKGEEKKIVWVNSASRYLKLVKEVKNAMGIADKDIYNLESTFRMKRYPLWLGSNKVYITDSELKCLRHLGQGYTCKQVAKILGIASRTVEAHAYNIKKKVGVRSQGEFLKIYHDNKQHSRKSF